MKKLNYILMLFVFLASLVPEATVFAQEDGIDTIQPDGSSGYDTYISSAAPTAMYGTDETMVIGHISSGASWLDVEDTDALLTYSTAFTQVNSSSHHGGSRRQSNALGVYVSYTATTTSFKYYAYTASDAGKVEIYIDDVSVGLYDLYSAADGYQQLIYTVGGLSLESHTIKVVNSGEKNAASGGYYMTIDYFQSAIANDTSRGLITFDMSTFANDIVVENATLSLWVAEDLANEASTLQAYTLKRDWDEDWATFTRYDNLDGSGAGWQDVLWEIAGADGSEDRLAEPSGEYALAADLTEGTLITIVLTPDDITQMIRENYFGFVLRTEMESNDAYKFYTSDYTTDPDKRPMLFITYTLNNAPDEITWTCVDLADTCWPPLNPEVPINPFKHKGVGYGGNKFGSPGWSYGDPYTNQGHIGAIMNCEPYPLCKDDFPVYYRLYYKYNYTPSWIRMDEGYVTTALQIMGGATVDIAYEEKPCPGGSTTAPGSCYGLFQGVIEPELIPTVATPASGSDFRIVFQFSAFAGGGMNDVTWSLYLSLEPFTEECADTYTTPLVDTINIDPTIETPVGMFGDETPVDEQGYPTVDGQIYMVRVQQGPWVDGTNDRYDTAVSSDGTTWMSLLEFANDALCIEVDVTNPDWLTVYFTATTETFYIRANDTAGAFADNTIHYPETPLQYVIGLSVLIDEADCTDQYVLEEVIASIILPGTSEEVPVNDPVTMPIIPGDWYGIEIAGGSWHEGEDVTERIDLEFKFDAGGIRMQDWQVLADGSHLVYCESTDHKIIFVQALGHEGQVLSLRVNDQDNPKDWGDNGGTLDINVYHADFTRIPHDCELNYNVGDFMSHDVVEANATNGKIFGSVAEDAGPIVQGTLEPGMIYALDTTDGPWWQTYTGGGYNINQEYYDVKVKTSLATEWSTLEAWPEELCVVKLDGLGHMRVFFEIPINTTEPMPTIDYFIKVGGASPVGRGSMGWNLYQAFDNSNTGENCSNFTYDPNEVPHYGGDVDARLENGLVINNLEPDSYFAIEIMETNEAETPDYLQKSGWWENEEAEERDDLQLSRDLMESDTGWYAPEESPHVLCSFRLAETNHLVFFIKTSNGAGDTWKLRADSTSFSDNIGVETYRLYHASVDGIDPWVSCLQDYTAHLPPLNTNESIPVRQEEGIRLLPMETSPEVIDTNGDGIIWWENLWLMPGHFYEVDTTNSGSAGWEEPGDHDGKAAELSSDDGVTWYTFDTHPDVICFHQEPNPERYWKAIFEVTEDQKWRIRVADEEGDFGDNGGSLYYNLYLVNEFPGCVFDCGGIDPPGTGETYDVCALALVKPAPLTLSEIMNLGNFLGEWWEYGTRSIFSYFAWCQRHTDALKAGIDQLKLREPYGTFVELDTIAQNIEAEAKSYDWDRDGASGNSVPADFSIFDFGNEDGIGPSSAQGVDTIFETYIMPQSGDAYDVWDGGDVVNLEQQTGLPDFYYSCNTVFADYLPSRLRTGTCFASAYWQETGAAFWIQLLLDIGAIFAMIMIIKSSVQSLVYMMTGVRIWTKDGILKVASEYGNMNAAAEIERQNQLDRDRLIRDLEDFRRR